MWLVSAECPRFLGPVTGSGKFCVYEGRRSYSRDAVWDQHGREGAQGERWRVMWGSVGVRMGCKAGVDESLCEGIWPRCGFFPNIYSFMWLHRVSDAAWGIFVAASFAAAHGLCSCGMGHQLLRGLWDLSSAPQSFTPGWSHFPLELVAGRGPEVWASLPPSVPEKSPTRDWTRVPCIARWILNP